MSKVFYSRLPRVSPHNIARKQPGVQAWCILQSWQAVHLHRGLGSQLVGVLLTTRGETVGESVHACREPDWEPVGDVAAEGDSCAASLSLPSGEDRASYDMPPYFESDSDSSTTIRVGGALLPSRVSTLTV